MLRCHAAVLRCAVIVPSCAVLRGAVLLYCYRMVLCCDEFH
jgi:hypothetical protein